MLTREEVAKWIRYDPNTGIFYKVAERTGRGRNQFPVGSAVGGLDNLGYLRVRVCGERHFGHNLAFLLMLGRWPVDRVDHIDHNPSNCQWSNLRECSESTNLKNKSRYRNNKSGITGVRKCGNKWIAEIYVDKVQVGRRFNSFEAAVEWRESIAQANGYHKNHGK